MLRTDVIYAVQPRRIENDVQYAVSPDGVGAYWFQTALEARLECAMEGAAIVDVDSEDFDGMRD